MIVIGGVGDGPRVGLGEGLGEVPLLVQFMPQKVELVKPDGFYPSMLYILDFPVEFTIVLSLCNEYTTTVNSFDGLPYHVYVTSIEKFEVAL